MPKMMKLELPEAFGFFLQSMETDWVTFNAAYNSGEVKDAFWAFKIVAIWHSAFVESHS